MREKLTIKLMILGLAAVFLLSMASYSTDQEVTTQGKPDKPPKPDKPQTEWIEFYGDLIGGQPVDGCCPNAGPSPPYRMYLGFDVGDNQAGLYDGYLFINFFGAGRNQQYMVQFWTEECDPAIDAHAIKIIGGVIDFDRRTKLLKVTFTDALCVNLCTGAPITTVSFTLIRKPYEQPPT